MKKLDHPNIIKYFSGWFNDLEKKIIMITELVSGGSLKDNLNRLSNIHLHLIKKWIIEILNGISYLHSNKIIHRDIKCENIFFDRITGIVKIGDLGLSKIIKDKNYYCNHFKGTEEFMAPEVHEGKYSFKADIYSLGITIIEMITNEIPYYECKGAFNIYETIKKGIYPKSLLKIDNEEIVDFIKLCLKNENDRPDSLELLQNKWLNDLESKENFECIKLKKFGNLKKPKSDDINNENIKHIKTTIDNSNFIIHQEKSLVFEKSVKFKKKSTEDLSYKKDYKSNLIKRKNTSLNVSIKNSNSFLVKDIMNDSIQIQFIIGKKEWKHKSKIYM